MIRRWWGKVERERGAAAVEFALLLPILLIILFGLIDFGRALNAQITLTQAAREGVRLAALGEPNVVSRTQAAATGLSNVSVTVTACPANGQGTSDAEVQTSYSFSFLTPVGSIAGMFGGVKFGSPITMTATEYMSCEV
jgi:Flp pilus assembly protein TadG